MNIRTSRHTAMSSGFSLVELLIAMVLGLILLAGVGGVFVSATGSIAVNRELDRSQETLRFAASLLTSELRQASLLPDPANPGFPDLDSRPVEVANVDDDGLNQAITVRYLVVNSGEAIHCDGTGVDGGSSLEKTFAVDEDGDLVCTSTVDGGVTESTARLVSGLSRIRVDTWIGTPAAPDAYQQIEYGSLADLEAADNTLIGVRYRLEHERVAGQAQAFVLTVALRNQVLHWFVRSQQS